MSNASLRELINLVESKDSRPRAGTIPYFIDESGQLFVCLFTSNNAAYGGTDPAVPKGGVDDGEEIVQGAMRETHEETGIPISDLGDIMLVKTSVVSGMTSSYDLHVYASRVPAMTKLGPMPEGQGNWFTIEDALRKIRSSHREFLNALVNKVQTTQ